MAPIRCSESERGLAQGRGRVRSPSAPPLRRRYKPERLQGSRRLVAPALAVVGQALELLVEMRTVTVVESQGWEYQRRPMDRFQCPDRPWGIRRPPAPTPPRLDFGTLYERWRVKRIGERAAVASEAVLPQIAVHPVISQSAMIRAGRPNLHPRCQAHPSREVRSEIGR